MCIRDRLATVLYYIGEVPMPFAANLKIGFSDLPALIGAIVAGPWAGVAVAVSYTHLQNGCERNFCTGKTGESCCEIRFGYGLRLLS